MFLFLNKFLRPALECLQATNDEEEKRDSADVMECGEDLWVCMIKIHVFTIDEGIISE